MGKINVLDFHVANLIAAGEVVDRPASVVKELLENAIDAGGDAITVEIKRGGVSFIRVSDNGCGMAREDVPIALKRHATSKIRNAEDLDSIETLGFRGEALAAISSVSRMRIMTKRCEDAAGTLMEAAGGRVQSISDAGCPDGTTVIVEDLFYNTPARLKFLKKDGTEAANVAAYVEKIALSHPEISIRFLSDGELKYATAGDDNLHSAIYAVLGRDFSKKLMEINGGFDGVTVSGFAGTPENYRGNRNMEIFFINQRFIRSKTISAALEQAYTTYIPSEKFPCAVLYLKMNPALVDVNVHPAKLEVKFSNERLVFEAVYYAVRGALEQKLARPEMQISRAAEKRQEQRKTVQAFVPQKEGRGGEDAVTDNRQMNRTLEDGIRLSFGSSVSRGTSEAVGEQAEAAKIQADRIASLPVQDEIEGKQRYIENAPPAVEPLLTEDLDLSIPRHIRQAFDSGTAVRAAPALERSAEHGDSTTNREETHLRKSDMPIADAQKAIAASSGTPSRFAAAPDGRIQDADSMKVPSYRMVGEVFRCYVILETADTMYLIDKHAAHERILFESFKDCVRRQERGERNSQLLLMPLVIPLSTDEAAIAADFSGELLSAGFMFEIKGREAYLTQIPAFLDTAAARDAFCEALTRLNESSGTADLSREQRYERALFEASCKAAIKAGRDYDAAHLKWICDRVMSNPQIRYCPHGRPVCFEMTKASLENRFGRT